MTPPRSIQLHRVLRTAPDKVYRAALDADAQSKWLPPYGHTYLAHDLETRAGDWFSKNPAPLATMPDMKSTAPHAPAVQVLARSFAVLDVLAQSPDPVPLKVVSAQTGLHPSTAHRILNDLVSGRWVDRPEAGSYQLGMRLLELGNLVKARLDVRKAALGPMRELHRLTQQSVNLSMRQGDELVHIEHVRSEPSGTPAVRAAGARAPLHLTSVGKLFLAQDEHPQVRSYAARSGLIGHTRHSITEMTALERELSHVLALGTARDNEELEIGVRCIAAGIHDDQGHLVAGLSISAPADRLDERWLEPLRHAVEQISAALGYKTASTPAVSPAMSTPNRTRRQRAGKPNSAA